MAAFLALSQTEVTFLLHTSCQHGPSCHKSGLEYFFFNFLKVFLAWLCVCLFLFSFLFLARSPAKDDLELLVSGLPPHPLWSAYTFLRFPVHSLRTSVAQAELKLEGSCGTLLPGQHI